MHILLVEDNPIDVRLVRRMLAQGQPRPYELVEATTIQEAIALLQRESVGVILLDLSLPDCRGLETFTRISEQARTRRSSSGPDTRWASPRRSLKVSTWPAGS